MSLNGDWLILNDLLLKYEGSKFQIDSLLLSQFALYQFEVKHFEGDYYINGKRFYTMAGKEINSPIIQIEKNETTLRQIVQNSVMPNLKVISFIVFTHPEFTLYQTPKDLSYLIFPTQLNKLMRNLNSQRTKATQKHFKFAEDLLSLQISEDPRQYTPEYSYESLKKGVVCAGCKNYVDSFMRRHSKGFYICDTCGVLEKVDDVIMRHVNELKLLFPEMKITTNLVYDWCGGVIQKRTIRRVLSKNLKKVGNTTGTYYV